MGREKETCGQPHPRVRKAKMPDPDPPKRLAVEVLAELLTRSKKLRETAAQLLLKADAFGPLLEEEMKAQKKADKKCRESREGRST